VKPSALRRVERAAAKAAVAREALDKAMAEARKEGHPLRDVGVAAHLSPEWVRKRTIEYWQRADS
jgi:hypothetical protein